MLGIYINATAFFGFGILFLAFALNSSASGNYGGYDTTFSFLCLLISNTVFCVGFCISKQRKKNKKIEERLEQLEKSGEN